MKSLELINVSAAPWGQPLLENVTVAMTPGDILVLAGPNGAGKSTLLKLIAGDISLTDGQLTIVKLGDEGITVIG